ncbi:MAG: chemotaxis protein CheW [Planctomycetota bacterium]
MPAIISRGDGNHVDEPQTNTNDQGAMLASRLITEIERWTHTPDEAVVAAELALAAAEARAAACTDLADVIESAAAESVLPIALRLMTLKQQAASLSAERQPDPVADDAQDRSTSAALPETPDWLRQPMGTSQSTSQTTTQPTVEPPAELTDQRDSRSDIAADLPAGLQTGFQEPGELPSDDHAPTTTSEVVTDSAAENVIEETADAVAFKDERPEEDSPRHEAFETNDVEVDERTPHPTPSSEPLTYASSLFGDAFELPVSQADAIRDTESADDPLAEAEPSVDHSTPTLFDAAGTPLIDTPADEPAAQTQLKHLDNNEDASAPEQPSIDEAFDGVTDSQEHFANPESEAVEQIESACDALGDLLAEIDSNDATADFYDLETLDGEIETIETGVLRESDSGATRSAHIKPSPTSTLASAVKPIRIPEPFFDAVGWFATSFEPETTPEPPRMPEADLKDDAEPDDAPPKNETLSVPFETRDALASPTQQGTPSPAPPQVSERSSQLEPTLEPAHERDQARSPEAASEPTSAPVAIAAPKHVPAPVEPSPASQPIPDPEPGAPTPTPSPAPPPAPTRRPGPITVRVLRARVGGQLIAFLLSSVQRVVKPTKDNVGSIGGASVLRIRDEVLPIIDLHQLIGEPMGEGVPIGVVVEAAGQQAVILVTSIVDQREAQTRPAEASTGGPFVGISVDEADAISLVLDADRVVSTAAPAPSNALAGVLGVP